MVIGPDSQAIRMRAAALSLAVGILMLGIKMYAYLITGSAAIFSDALESVVHVAAVVFMYWMLRFAGAPPDAEHPYGHGKAEYLSIGFEGGAIALAGLAIIWEAAKSLLAGHQPESIRLGILLVVVAGIINLALGLYLCRIGKQTGSRILIADGVHVLSDSWTSGGVLIGIVIISYLPVGPARIWCDAVVAMLVALIIMVIGARMVREAVRGLLDEVDPGALERVVAAINEIRDPAWRDVHNLRLRRSGDMVYVDFHLVVPSLWSVAAAHSAVERLEQHILTHLGAKGAVMVHLDHPHTDPVIGLDQTATSADVQVFTVASASRVKAD
jgi:cation diffusion facilitator family transporter